MGASRPVMVLVLALSAGLYTLAVSAWRLGGGPGAVIFVFAAGAVLGPVDSLATVGERTIATAWAAIGATAVMQGAHLHLTMNRSLQRMAGTVLGACIVWAILAQNPSFWAIAIAVVFFQYITEVVIGFNYALGQVAITPMALLMTHLAAPVAHSNMPVERVIDTIVGAAIGIIFAVIFSTVDDHAYLARRHGKFKLWRRNQ
ncbi:FUSC family protein [Pusillimonas sp. MFBS29]|uniref:FUSC family protein n=1 Tax=Pusillimonas sp. MFBS29 TaxID=2886690 RepID=UPI001D12C9E0|nr:FUSC family protein [Pusillimonas sp. MFBS29]MCC2595731.1 FUSC family protein [Pusillimonas sp. MFBS29]